MEIRILSFQYQMIQTHLNTLKLIEIVELENLLELSKEETQNIQGGYYPPRDFWEIMENGPQIGPIDVRTW